MHQAVFDFVKRLLADPERTPRPERIYFVAEIGSRYVNGSVRELFPAHATYVGVDIQPGAGVDVIADGATFVPAYAPDVVVSTETLEHAPDPRGIIMNAGRILVPGGVLLLTAATNPRPLHSGVHGRPGILEPGEVYRNIDPDELRAWLTAVGFVDVLIEVDRAAGDVHCFARKPGGNNAH